MTTLLLKLQGIWPDWLLWSIGILIIVAPAVFAFLVKVFFVYRKPKTRRGIWLKEHHEKIENFAMLWVIFFPLLLYIETFVIWPGGTGLSLTELFITTAGVALVGKLLGSLFQRRK